VDEPVKELVVLLSVTGSLERVMLVDETVVVVVDEYAEVVVKVDEDSEV
jgi:hypothetical protein